jgi:predicted negative regulator of RcsB-dependent stress response|tara:strand:- start:348 stop:992 length:645 start_codon:yes stop_codon:yes gene_type:complete
MDEEIAIIDTNTRNEKIKNFLVKNKFFLISSLIIIIFLTISYLSFEGYQKNKKVKISNMYNSTTVDFTLGNKFDAEKKLTEIIKKKDSTYSPLALYFLIDNKIIKDKKKLNQLFDIIITEIKLETEIKNLLIYKKALFNSDLESENNLLKILNPIINTESIWKPHALYLMAEYFYNKNEKQKAKEFFNKILLLNNVNQDIQLKSKNRLNRDLSD